MPGAETVKLQVELDEKKAEARLKALDKLAKEMGSRKITLNFDEASLAKWKNATGGMSAAQINAWAKIATAVEKTAQTEISAANRVQTAVVQAEAKKVQATERTAQERIKADAKVEAAEIKATASTRKHSTAVSQLGAEASKTSNIFDTLTARFTAANIVATLVTRGMSSLKQAVREANEELKSMDKELTTIKMVTGASDSYIDQLTTQAFAGAKANGRSVNDYLTAAERFARAGYRDNIDQLSQLSLMTQNIGGVEEETAAKFLLAADAAWKLGGSYDALMEVLDGVSSVADQNATDLGKIAEGITVAGSAFANAGESAQTFTAMLGVTTASTQRSGSEMARGLRTILFRVRQVKAAFDDGEIVDAKSISNAAKALEDIGISVLDETGDLKSMSQILTELSWKWGTLSKSQQSYLQNYLAGNRNGNVLFALMDNWGTYEKMLAQYENSAGTALSKNEEYTKSWAAETDRLKSSWTELMGTITANGDLQKSFIGGLSDFVESVNKLLKWSKENDPTVKSGSLGGAVTNSVQEKAERKKAQEAYKQGYMWSGYGQSVKKADEELKKYTDDAQKSSDATGDLEDSVEKATTAFEKQRNKISEVAKAIKEEKSDAVNSLADVYKAAMEAADKGYYGSNAYRQGGALFFSEGNLDQLEKEGKLSARTYLDAYFTEVESGNYSNAAAKFFENITGGSNTIRTITGELLASVKDVGEGYKWTFDVGSRSIEEYLQSLESNTGIGAAFWASMIESLGMYSGELDEWKKYNEKEKTEVKVDTEEASKKLDKLQEKKDKLEEKTTVTIDADTAEAQENAKALQNAVDKLEDKTITITLNVEHSGRPTATVPSVKRGAGSVGSAYISSGIGGGGGIQMIYEEGSSSILGRMGYASGKRDNYSGIALVNDEYPANGSTPELIISKSHGMAYIANGGRPALVNLASDDIVLTARETKSAFGIPGFAIGKDIQDEFYAGRAGRFDGTSGSGTSFTTSKGAASGSVIGSAVSSDPTDTWNQLKKLIDYMVEEQKGILDQNLKVLDKQLEELEATRKAQKTEDELSEKQLAVDEALLDLQKAQNERTVRYYNESTQQWEWMADQGALAKAEEAYSDALKDLNDFLAELDFNEQKAAIQAQKDALNEAFNAYKEGWDTIVKSIEKPTGDLAALFEELKTNGTDAMKAQAGNIESLLGALEVGFFSGIGDVTDAATSGVSAVVQRANDFLESVKKTEEAKSTEQNKASSAGGSGGGGNGQGTVQKQTAATKQLAKEASKPVVLDSLKAGGVPVTYGVGGSTSVASSGLAKNNLTLADAGVLSSTIKSMTSTVNNNGNNTYINGVKIGSEMINQPFGKVLSVLSIHSNGAR